MNSLPFTRPCCVWLKLTQSLTNKLRRSRKHVVGTRKSGCPSRQHYRKYGAQFQSHNQLLTWCMMARHLTAVHSYKTMKRRRPRRAVACLAKEAYAISLRDDRVLLVTRAPAPSSLPPPPSGVGNPSCQERQLTPSIHYLIIFTAPGYSNGVPVCGVVHDGVRSQHPIASCDVRRGLITHARGRHHDSSRPRHHGGTCDPFAPKNCETVRFERPGHFRRARESCDQRVLLKERSGTNGSMSLSACSLAVSSTSQRAFSFAAVRWTTTAERLPGGV